LSSNGSFYQSSRPPSYEVARPAAVSEGVTVPRNAANGSFYLNGTAYNTLENADVVLAQMNAILASTTAEQALATAAAMSAQVSAAAAASSAVSALQKAANLSDLVSIPTALLNLGLNNVNNTSDANKPVSTAQAAADALVASNAAAATALKANIASPALTGVPTAPTAAALTNTTQLATTAFVDAARVVLAAADALKAPLASPALTGVPTAPTASVGTNTTQLATTAFVTAADVVVTTAYQEADALKAPLNSPALTGAPTAPTPTTASGIATKAYVDASTPSGLRTRLLTATTFYVRSADGNDANTGLVNSAGGAFKTIQACYNAIAGNYDVGGQAVTIAGVGAFTAGLDLSAPWLGGGSLAYDGNTGSITTVGGTSFITSGALPGVFTIKNVTMVCTSPGGTAIYHNGAGTINVGTGCVFGDMAGGDHMFAGSNGALIACGANYTVAGGGRSHIYARLGGTIDLYAGVVGSVTTVSANCSFTGGFAVANSLGVVQSITGTRSFSLGSFTVTGARYSATGNALVNSQGGGANYFPGNSAGTVSTGGLYV
jgi:hypothetical protein